jgi:uncharacterized membrane protein HdeD (DUF308 family)
MSASKQIVKLHNYNTGGNSMTNVAGGLAFRGILAILFGIAAVFWPDVTLKTVVYLFSAFVLIGGVVDLVVGLSRMFTSGISIISRVLTLLFGVLQIGVGVYLLRHLAVTFATLILLIGFLFIIRGVFELVEAVMGDGSGGYRAVMAVVGVLAILVGILMLFQPVASGVAFVWLLGIYGLIAGPLMIAAAVEMNKLETVDTVPRTRARTA